MSVPYKRMEFAASSGNVAKVKVFPPNGDKLVVDVTWEDEVSDADIAEHDAWFPEAVQAIVKEFGGQLAPVLFSQHIEDDEIRQAVIQAYLSKPRMG